MQLNDFFAGRRQYRHVWVFLALTAMTLYLHVRYESVFRWPNGIVLTLGFDGVKNYFTTAWHLKHDPTRLGYQGMNYPYGEHVLFTDNQPALVNTARLVSHYVPQLKEQGVALINLFQLFHVVFAVFCFILLFRRLDLPAWYGALSAFLLVLLTPQHIRWDGHFGLSHAWIIPLLLLFMHTYDQRKYKRRISLSIGALALVTAQMHMYYFGLFVLFITSWQVVSFLRQPRAAKLYKRIVHWLLMLIVPYAGLQFWMQAEHFASDRPANPYGFLQFRGYWEGIFLPYPEWPMYKWIDTNITKIRPMDGECNAYVGMFATLFFVFVLVRGFQLFKKSEPLANGEDGFHRNYLRNIWWASVLLALFTCGFPHAIPGMEWVSDAYGPIKQFRSMGRFNWLLFYVFNVAALYWIWHFAQRQTKVWAKALALTLPFLMLGYEAYTHQDLRRAGVMQNMFTVPDPQSTQLDWLPKLDTATFQALYPMPYYHVGSENLGSNPQFDLFLLTQRTSYATGLPEMGVFLSRTSIGQTVQQMQLALEPVEMPRILHDMVSDKDLALFSLPQYAAETVKRHAHMLANADTIFTNANATVWRLPLDSLKAAVRNQIDRQKDTIRQMHSISAGQWLKAPGDPFFFHNHYDTNREVLDPVAGNGALSVRMSDTTLFYQGEIPQGRYVVSFWVNAMTDLSIHAELKIDLTDRTTGARKGFVHEGARYYTRCIKDGWALMEVPFEVPDGATNIKAYQHKKKVDAMMQLDEMQIRCADADVYYRDNQYLVRNNRWYVD